MYKAVESRVESFSDRKLLEFREMVREGEKQFTVKHDDASDGEIILI